MDDERVWKPQLFMPKGELQTTDASKNLARVSDEWMLIIIEDSYMQSLSNTLHLSVILYMMAS